MTTTTTTTWTAAAVKMSAEEDQIRSQLTKVLCDTWSLPQISRRVRSYRKRPTNQEASDKQLTSTGGWGGWSGGGEFQDWAWIQGTAIEFSQWNGDGLCFVVLCFFLRIFKYKTEKWFCGFRALLFAQTSSARLEVALTFATPPLLPHWHGGTCCEVEWSHQQQHQAAHTENPRQSNVSSHLSHRIELNRIE